MSELNGNGPHYTARLMARIVEAEPEDGSEGPSIAVMFSGFLTEDEARSFVEHFLSGGAFDVGHIRGLPSE